MESGPGMLIRKEGTRLIRLSGVDITLSKKFASNRHNNLHLLSYFGVRVWILVKVAVDLPGGA